MLCESAITRSERRDRERHQHPHALVAQAGVRLGEARVDQVVHRHHAAEAPPQRARCCARLCTRSTPRARGQRAAAAPARRAPTARGCARSRARSRPAAAPPTGRPPAAAASRLTNAVKRVPGGRLRRAAPGSARARRPPCRRSRRGRGRSGSGRRAPRVRLASRELDARLHRTSHDRYRRARRGRGAGRPRARRTRVAARACRAARGSSSLRAVRTRGMGRRRARRALQLAAARARATLGGTCWPRARPIANATCSCRPTRI